MAEKRTEKLLSAHVDVELCDRFLKQAHDRCIVKKRALAGAVRLWSELPAEMQIRLVNRSVDEGSFIDLVRQVVDEYIGKSPQKQNAQSPKNSRHQLHDAMSRLKEMVEIEQQQPGTIYRVLDAEEQKVLDEFRKLVAPKERKKAHSA